jgi:hypothetical protein
VDLRFVAFDLIARDATLRTLLANYVRRLEADGPPEDGAVSCFVSLRWALDERPSAPVGSELLTAQVHVSPDDSCPLAHLDLVLQRLCAALSLVGPNPCITAHCLTMSGAIADGRFGTLFRTGTWAIAPVPTAPEDAAPTTTVPWSGWVEPDASRLLVTGVGALSMN